MSKEILYAVVELSLPEYETGMVEWLFVFDDVNDALSVSKHMSALPSEHEKEYIVEAEYNEGFNSQYIERLKQKGLSLLFTIQKN